MNQMIARTRDLPSTSPPAMRARSNYTALPRKFGDPALRHCAQPRGVCGSHWSQPSANDRPDGERKGIAGRVASADRRATVQRRVSTAAASAVAIFAATLASTVGIFLIFHIDDHICHRRARRPLAGFIQTPWPQSPSHAVALRTKRVRNRPARCRARASRASFRCAVTGVSAPAYGSLRISIDRRRGI